MIELLIGPIASGKSTYSSKRAKDGAIIINDDSFVLALHGGNYDLYNKELKPLYKHLECSAIIMAIALGKDVIVDRTNMDKNTRIRYISLAKMLDTKIKAVCFKNEGPKVHADRRFKADCRGQSYETWLEVAKHHESQYEQPHVEEGFCLMEEI